MKKYVPDLLALFRIFSAPVILYLLLLDGTDEGLMLVPAIIAFIAAWTDFFDGRLARKWNVSSKSGAFLDSIADKIFITFIFVGFTYIERVSIWITVLFVMMDFPLIILSFTIADLFVLYALIFSYISGYQYISGYLKQTK